VPPTVAIARSGDGDLEGQVSVDDVANGREARSG
jgi:hypothetical protein